MVCLGGVWGFGEAIRVMDHLTIDRIALVHIVHDIYSLFFRGGGSDGIGFLALVSHCTFIGARLMQHVECCRLCGSHTCMLPRTLTCISIQMMYTSDVKSVRMILGQGRSFPAYKSQSKKIAMEIFVNKKEMANQNKTLVLACFFIIVLACWKNISI
jgi:hypothetical protein